MVEEKEEKEEAHFMACYFLRSYRDTMLFTNELSYTAKRTGAPTTPPLAPSSKCAMPPLAAASFLKKVHVQHRNQALPSSSSAPPLRRRHRRANRTNKKDC